MSDCHHDQDEAIRLIKQIHADAGQLLLDDEVVEFFKKPIYLGRPPLPTLPKGTKRPGSTRGRPKNPKNPYESGFELRRGIYVRLVLNPESSKIAAHAKKIKAAQNDQIIRNLWVSSRKPRCSRTTWIVAKLMEYGKNMNRQSVVRSLKRQNLWEPVRVIK